MTQHDRSAIVEEISKSLNLKLFLSTIGIVVSVVWSAATIYYNNKEVIKEVSSRNDAINERQDLIITNNSVRINRIESNVFKVQ